MAWSALQPPSASCPECTYMSVPYLGREQLQGRACVLRIFLSSSMSGTLQILKNQTETLRHSKRERRPLLGLPLSAD